MALLLKIWLSVIRFFSCLSPRVRHQQESKLKWSLDSRKDGNAFPAVADINIADDKRFRDATGTKLSDRMQVEDSGQHGTEYSI